MGMLEKQWGQSFVAAAGVYLWSLHGVDLPNQQEDDESDNQEAKDGIEKYPVVDGRRTSCLRPSAKPIGGMMMSSTSEAIILPKAAPITMPTAMSSTLPRIANSLNSFSIVTPPMLN
jgi:hypothetical protein